MSRIQLVDPAQTTPNRQAQLQAIGKAFGATPNMFKAVANSPAALKSLWGFFGALSTGVVGAKLGEQIAVAIADQNRCEYCLSAHNMLGNKAGVSAEELKSAQAGTAQDPRTAAALKFALTVVRERGQISAEDVSALRSAGFDDEHIVEILAHVALNLFTNYVNVALDVPLDFSQSGAKSYGESLVCIDLRLFSWRRISAVASSQSALARFAHFDPRENS